MNTNECLYCQFLKNIEAINVLSDTDDQISKEDVASMKEKHIQDQHTSVDLI